MNKNLKFLSISILIGVLAASSSMGFALQERPFQAVRKYEGQFSDVKHGDWFFHAVKKAYMMNLINGRSSSVFAPKENIDVSEVIAISSRIHATYHGKKMPASHKNARWYTPYIEYATNNGIIKSYDFKGRYDRPATRGETAYIMSGSLPKSEFKAKIDKQIPDVSTATRYHEEIALLFQAGVIEGKDIAGVFRPNENISRSEVAMIAVKVICEEERLANRPFMVKISGEESDRRSESLGKEAGEVAVREEAELQIPTSFPTEDEKEE